jgi:DNA-binding Lrp family transcriptional regulator
MNRDTLIALLRANARASLSDLAKELNSSEDTVAQAINALETEGAILGYQAIVDPAKLPSQKVVAVIEVKITPERGGGFDRLAQRISKFNEVQGCYLMSGGYDLMVIVQGSNLQEVAAFVSEKLSTIRGVISTATHFRLKAYKENDVVLVRDQAPQRLIVSP